MPRKKSGTKAPCPVLCPCFIGWRKRLPEWLPRLGRLCYSCLFDAMYMDEETGLPVIIEENCVACGACVKACPRAIIELRNAGKKSRRIFVCCVNTEKGGPAKKNCSVACIGCGKCEKECAFDAITSKTTWHTLITKNVNSAANALRFAPPMPSTN
jgi:Na+-translocating ferredoxin:NAD+ oxidoreductase RNF subunit RnfB